LVHLPVFSGGFMIPLRQLWGCKPLGSLNN
jgi:hypothetical protein